MEKPLNLLIEEGKIKIIQIINETKLPAFLLEPILKDIYLEILNNKRNEYEKSKTQYEQSLLKEKTEESENEN